MNIVGVDEVGRGSWAGPLVAAAVLVDGRFQLSKLNDSKKISVKLRESLVTQIKLSSTQIGIGWVHSTQIDEIGLAEANKLAMQKALSQINKKYDRLLVDGNIAYLPDCETIIGGDGIEPAISAASIIAKVARDNYMKAIALIHPVYGFEKHVGYGTAVHKKALEQFGTTTLHRKSYKPIARLGLNQ